MLYQEHNVCQKVRMCDIDIFFHKIHMKSKREKNNETKQREIEERKGDEYKDKGRWIQRHLGT